MKMNTQYPAIVLDMSETGLGVGRSLGRHGINVIGLDSKWNIGFSSRYIKARLCPDPLIDEKLFIEFLIKISEEFDYKPVLFIGSDNFVRLVSDNRCKLEKYFLFNMPSKKIMDNFIDKYNQYKLVLKTGIDVPKTYFARNNDDVKIFKSKLKYPGFIKGKDVNSWRKSSFKAKKGYLIKSEKELKKFSSRLFKENIEFLIQEVVQGPDTNHYKICSYISKNGKVLLNFTLQKIRQSPIRFGIGSNVVSLEYPELEKLGNKLSRAINYHGVISTEFKIDKRDKKLKLIEINPRYWQQNALTERCGMNFPLMQYLDLTGQNPEKITMFEKGIRWVNIYMDAHSFLSYNRIKELSLIDWIKSLKGKKIYSAFAWDDPLPALFEIWSDDKLRKLPEILFNRNSNEVLE